MGKLSFAIAALVAVFGLSACVVGVGDDGHGHRGGFIADSDQKPTYVVGSATQSAYAQASIGNYVSSGN